MLRQDIHCRVSEQREPPLPAASLFLSLLTLTHASPQHSPSPSPPTHPVHSKPVNLPAGLLAEAPFLCLEPHIRPAATLVLSASPPIPAQQDSGLPLLLFHCRPKGWVCFSSNQPYTQPPVVRVLLLHLGRPLGNPRLQFLHQAGTSDTHGQLSGTRWCPAAIIKGAVPVKGGTPAGFTGRREPGAEEKVNGQGWIASLWLCGHPCCQHDDVFLGRSLLWVCVVGESLFAHYMLLPVASVLLSDWRRWVFSHNWLYHFLCCPV